MPRRPATTLRREPLTYVRGLLELEMAPSQDERGRAQAIPGLLPEEDLLAPIRALLRQDWAALASGALLSPRNAKGTLAVPGMAALLRGLARAKRSRIQAYFKW
jgi:hypothetical protein